MKTTLRVCSFALALTVGILSAKKTDYVIDFGDLVSSRDTALEAFNKELREHPLVVVKCSRENCPPCRKAAPLFAKIAETYAGKVRFIALNVEQHAAAIRAYNIRSVPTFLIFSQGKPLDPIIGLSDRKGSDTFVLMSKILDQELAATK